METPERFLACLKLCEFFNFPENARDSQLRILDYLVKFMTEERATDALRNETLTRIVKVFKVHHPTLRNVLLRLLERIIDLGFPLIDLPRLVSLAICDITSI